LILALFGTSSHPFVRLMDALAALAATTEEEIYVQAGCTPLPQAGLSGSAFLEPEDLERRIQGASLVISQGGFGSMRDVLHARVPLVAVPRLEELDEARGNQTVLVKRLEASGVIIAVYDLADLPAAVQRARTTPMAAPPTSTIPNRLAELLASWEGL